MTASLLITAPTPTPNEPTVKPPTFEPTVTGTIDDYSATIYNATIEVFSDFSHQQWANWTNYQLSYITLDPITGEGTVPAWAMERLKRQANTPYHDLTHSEKESDRNEARKFYKLATGIFFDYDPSGEQP